MGEVRPLNLALQGGGSHGAFAWGILDSLIESERYRFEGISATSAGAVNAVVMAQGFLEGGHDGARSRLKAFWKALSHAGMLFNPVRRLPWERLESWPLEPPASYAAFDTLTRIISPYWFNPFDINPLRALLLEHVDFEALRRRSRLKLFLNATNVRTGRVKVFHRAEITVDAVLASACLPFLFQAVEIGGEAYWDGGYMGNPSLYPLYRHTPIADILLVLINPFEREEVPTTGSAITDRINEISFNSSLLHELRAIAFVQKLIARGWLADPARESYQFVRIHAVRADKFLSELGVSTKLESDWRLIEELFGYGRDAGRIWLEACGADVGVRSGLDLHASFLEPPRHPI